MELVSNNILGVDNAFFLKLNKHYIFLIAKEKGVSLACSRLTPRSLYFRSYLLTSISYTHYSFNPYNHVQRKFYLHLPQEEFKLPGGLISAHTSEGGSWSVQG